MNHDRHHNNYKRNSTLKHVRGVFTGENGTKVDVIDTYDWKRSYDIWGSDECNRVGGSQGTNFPPPVTRASKLEIYMQEICRILPLVYTKDSYEYGIPVYRFQPPEDVWADAKKKPENSCYCLDKSSCLPSGLTDISPCLYGYPGIISFPHFYLGDPKLLETVDGLNPRKDDHEFYAHVEPKFGVILNGSARLQGNLLVKSVKGVRQIKAFKTDTVLPLFWGEEVMISFSSTMLLLIRMGHFALSLTSDSFVMFLIALAFISSVLSVWLLYKRLKNNKISTCEEKCVSERLLKQKK